MDDKTRKIWLAIPCYGAKVFLGTFRALFHDYVQLLMQGHAVRIFDEVGHGDIYSARAEIVAHFLADDYATDLVMIDSDVAWAPMSLVRLLDHDEDFVAGVYPKRELPTKFTIRSETNTLDVDEASGLAEVWGVPGGFMRMSRVMLEKMVFSYRNELETYAPWTPGKSMVRLFDPYWYTDEKGRRRTLSEDFSFCQRWRDLGGRIKIDTRIPMSHIGPYEFVGRLAEPAGGMVSGFTRFDVEKPKKDEAA